MLNTGTLVGKNWGVRNFFDFHMLLVHSVRGLGQRGAVAPPCRIPSWQPWAAAGLKDDSYRGVSLEVSFIFQQL